MARSGLRGVPVGTAAKALRANGERPFLHKSRPPAEKIPQRRRSRRLICPWDRALTISARLALARAAFAGRRADAVPVRYMGGSYRYGLGREGAGRVREALTTLWPLHKSMLFRMLIG